MNIQQLKILVLIEKHKRLTTVAQILKIKQPTVSFHMKKLEEVTSVTLFHQHSGGVFLTDAGKTLYRYARRIVMWLEEAGEQMYDYRENSRGSVKIGASNTAATYYLVDLLAGLHEKYPNVHIKTIVKNTPIILHQLKNYELDFGLVADRNITDPDIIVKPLIEDELGLVMPIGHPLAHHKLINKEIFKYQNWILREKDSSSRIMIDEWAVEQDIELKAFLELGATEAIKKAVQSNIGISILSRLSVKDEIDNKKLVYKELNSSILKRNIFIVYNRHHQITPIVKLLVDYFQNEPEGQGL
ncbi:DNA-binding transcriptional regulator, LysR family [Gracilibacillus ureilyticus]|uniref:DNA-binding transcriptional regulator, LysR family n=1 Tax=Gracilibacillus ureilyticus TaxID=531814 RepID=A0A1H9TYR0_9BACI|nr:LysR family transcriptional regulator [Gracilibacillus ureilyticus]SES02249.1 DNA-binding transcriptional regulator, LysR family [Gracilibacillus ureilyticus]